MTQETSKGILDRLNRNDRHNRMSRGRRLGRTAVLASGVAALALTPQAVSFTHNSLKSQQQANTVPDLPLDSIHKTVVIGQEYSFKTDSGKVVSIKPNTLWDVAEAAGLDYDVRAVTDMEQQQLESEGVDVNNIQPGTEVRVPIESRIGTPYYPE